MKSSRIKRTKNRILSFFSILAFFYIVADLFSQNRFGNKIILKWESPPEGTAVSYDNEKDYLRQPPVLLSEMKQAEPQTFEINMAPTLQKLILPGSTDQTENQAEEEYLGKKGNLGLMAAQKAIQFFESHTRVVNVNGSNLNIETDCASFVRAAYWEASGQTLDLFRESLATNSINPANATGVTLLSEYLRKHKRYQLTQVPQVGDIIIFDNTYDKNGNRQRDDYHTHTGIVTAVRNDNTIEFIHGNISRTVKKGFINFKYKNASSHENQPVNSYIRPRYTWEADTTTNLASHLVRAFGGL